MRQDLIAMLMDLEQVMHRNMICTSMKCLLYETTSLGPTIRTAKRVA